MGAVESDKRFRILSLDSGGVYGLFSMLMLRELCRDPLAGRSLLERGCVDLFAGTGAGAINALILAKYDDPRDGIDEAIEFWRDERLYRNNPLLNMVESMQGWMTIVAEASTPQRKYEQALRYWNDRRTLLDPWSAWQEAMGQGSWFGARDVMTVLKDHFKGLRLGDLRQKVLVTAFNWSGDADLPTNERHWKPKVYCNFPESEKDCGSMVVDVAFSALSWMYTLPIYNGEQGGGWFAPDPTLCAVAKVVNFVGEKLKPIDLSERWRASLDDPLAVPDPKDADDRRKAVEALRDRVNAFFAEFIVDAEDEAYKYLLRALRAADAEGGEGKGGRRGARTRSDTAGDRPPIDEGRLRLLGEAFPYFDFLRKIAGEGDVDVDARVLRHLSVLSVGNGVRVPFLPVETEEWGYMQWARGVYNPALKRWIQPDQYTAFQAPEEMAREQCRWLLNDPDLPSARTAEEERYHRLGPSVFDTPVEATITRLRNNPAYLASLVREMEQKSGAETVREEYRDTLNWLAAQGWFDEGRWATHLQS